jgi:hypothetical protein
MMLDAIADKGEAQLDSFLEAEIDQRLSIIVSRPIDLLPGRDRKVIKSGVAEFCGTQSPAKIGKRCP